MKRPGSGNRVANGTGTDGCLSVVATRLPGGVGAGSGTCASASAVVSGDPGLRRRHAGEPNENQGRVVQ
jgi:hypothetical protein